MRSVLYADPLRGAIRPERPAKNRRPNLIAACAYGRSARYLRHVRLSGRGESSLPLVGWHPEVVISRLGASVDLLGRRLLLIGANLRGIVRQPEPLTQEHFRELAIDFVGEEVVEVPSAPGGRLLASGLSTMS